MNLSPTTRNRINKRRLAALAACTALTFGAGAAVAAAAPSSHPQVADTTAPAPETAGETATATPGKITVPGTGKVTVEPDTAVLTVGVQVTADTGSAAMEQLTTDSNALTKALVDGGIAERDVQTSGLSLWSTTGEDGITVTGYQASINVNVTIRDITTIGATIDTAQAAAGAGFTIGGVSFSFADPESVLADARVAAVENARSVAKQYADAAGVELGDVVSIVDASVPAPPVDVQFSRAAAPTADESLAVAPGSLDLTVEIVVTFATS